MTPVSRQRGDNTAAGINEKSETRTDLQTALLCAETVHGLI